MPGWRAGQLSNRTDAGQRRSSSSPHEGKGRVPKVWFGELKAAEVKLWVRQ